MDWRQKAAWDTIESLRRATDNIWRIRISELQSSEGALMRAGDVGFCCFLAKGAVELIPREAKRPQGNHQTKWADMFVWSSPVNLSTSCYVTNFESQQDFRNVSDFLVQCFQSKLVSWLEQSGLLLFIFLQIFYPLGCVLHDSFMVEELFET